MNNFQNLIIDASAGTGKTYTICEKVIERIKAGYSIRDFVIMTYTEKAAGELVDRIRKRLKEEKEKTENLTALENQYIRESLRDFDFATIGTIHSVCKKILKEYAFECGVSENLALEDTEAFANEAFSKVCLEWLYSLIEKSSLSNTDFNNISLNKITELAVSFNKNDEFVSENLFPKKMNFDIEKEIFESVLKNYRENIKNGCVMNFDMIINIVAEAVERDFIDESDNKTQYPKENGFVKELQKRWKVCIIDEFQDTSPQQWTIAEGIFLKRDDKENNPHLIIVGDMKQSIYSFQGANVETYLNAKKEIHSKYNGISDTLNENYRTNENTLKGLNEIFSAQAVSEE